ncbi:hypothetical protein ACFRI7_27230 [Streptomyces sp. NPDC056716]|uniref:hypothetical protein n=1 Tax=unclassified Streptomyces TaxID=2593676 RepID=UPI0036C10A87
MWKTRETSGSHGPVAASAPALTTRVPDSAAAPLDGSTVDRQALNRLLPSRRLAGPSFNSSI